MGKKLKPQNAMVMQLSKRGIKDFARNGRAAE